MAKITHIIPVTRGEQILDVIAQILALELKNQVSLIGDQELDTGIWTSRFIPFDKTELPAANISLSNDEFTAKNVKSQDVTYTYLIDVYVRGKDEMNSILKKNRIAGLIRGILDNPVYKTLGLTPGFIQTTAVKAIRSAEPQAENDTEYISMRQIEFEVKTVEDTRGIDAPIVGSTSTVVKIAETDKGYKWEWVGDGVLVTEDEEIPIETEEGGEEFAPEDSPGANKKLSETTEINLSDLGPDHYLPVFVGGVSNLKIKASVFSGAGGTISDYEKVIPVTGPTYQDDTLIGAKIFGMIYIDKMPYDSADGIVFNPVTGELDFSGTATSQIYEGQKLFFTYIK